MSASDSDLDYQSADDDNEFDTEHSKEEFDSKEFSTSEEIKQEIVKDDILERTSHHDADDGLSLNENLNKLAIKQEGNLESKDNCTSDLQEEIPGVILKSNLSKTAEDETPEEISCKDEMIKNTPILIKESLKQSGNHEGASGTVEESETYSNSENNSSKKEGANIPVKAEIPNASNEKSEKSSLKPTEREPTQENQRVVLRLEKLINQKHQKSKETSPLKEKPSDLVNMLQEQPKAQQSSWGFGSWGSNLLSTAASSVSTFSSQVSQGIGSVLETVESSLGAPEPEELAKALNEKKKEQANSSDDTDVQAEKDDIPCNDDLSDSKVGLLPDVSFFTKVIENTGSKVIMGGLDTLEFIGKKTMNILTEGDPGLRSTKRSLFGDSVNLSEILREAKTRAEQEQENNPDDADNIHFGQVFDEEQGLVHLEALEILSKQSQVKFQRLLMRHSKKVEVKEKLEEIRSICENLPSFDDPSESEQFDDFETVFKKHSIELSIPLNVESIIKTQRQIHENMCQLESSTEESTSKEIFKSAISSLAEFTAKSIETFHKIAELILVQPNISKEVEQCATNLTGLTTVMCIEINNMSSRYHKCLDSSNGHSQGCADSDIVDTTALATNLYVEAANCNNYIQDAYQMIVPILQVWVLEALDDN